MTVQLEAVDFTRTYTVEEFLNLDLPDDGINYELIGGKLMPSSSPDPGPSAPHGKLLIRLGGKIEAFAGVSEKAAGTIYGECSCTLGLANSYVVPDLAFVKAERIPANGFSGSITVAPDLIVEINSPSDTLEKIHNKITIYQQAEVRLIWSIYLLDKYVVVYRLNQPNPLFLGLDGELDGEDVLPGFKLAISKLFE
jgi:Uma2 family endonuclease